MTTPIKLTDEVLAVMVEIIDESPFRAMWTTDQFLVAVRTLRDRARAVVDSVDTIDVGSSGVATTVCDDALGALDEVLPEVKP